MLSYTDASIGFEYRVSVDTSVLSDLKYKQNTNDDDNDKARTNIVEESVGPLTDAFNYIWMVIRGETGSAEKLRSGSKWLFLAGE